jgi:hypothetical protein
LVSRLPTRWFYLSAVTRHVGTIGPIGGIGGQNILVLATCSVSGFEQVGLLAPQGVFQSADGVLHFALELIGFSFAFELAVAGHLPTTSLACSAEPWMRSLSIIMASNILNAVGL